MSPKLAAYCVHLFTATGAVVSMFAMLAAVDGAWSLMFLWLVVALVIDGIDGPLARHFHVGTHAAKIDGVTLDLIIDYLTYVFIPAFALFHSGLIPGWTGWVAICVICFASALYFADTRMKNADGTFAGFPACWNMLALVMFAVQPPFWAIVAVAVVLAGAMFLPVKFVHPVRTRRWRAVTLPVALVWVGLGAWAAAVDFTQPAWVGWALVAASAYLTLAGAAMQAVGPRR